MSTFPFRFGPGECCCPCWHYTDLFNQEDTTNLEDNWNEETGDWEVLDEELHEKIGGGGTSDAKIICKHPVPDARRGEMYITVKVIDAVEGDVFKIYPCCPSPSTIGPVEVVFTVLAGNQWKIEIGAETVTQQAVPVLGGVVLDVCADHKNEMVLANITNSVVPGPGPCWADTTDPGDGRYAGIGHNNTTTGATFDSFEVGELRSSTKVCRHCWCECERHPIKKHLTLTFYNGVDRCECLTGADNDEIPLVWDWNGATPRWYGEGSPGGDLPGVTATLVCDDEGKDWELTLTPVLCFVGNPQHPDLDLSTCDPFNLVYGPRYMAYTNCGYCYALGVPSLMECTGPTPPTHCFGEYWMSITED